MDLCEIKIDKMFHGLVLNKKRTILSMYLRKGPSSNQNAKIRLGMRAFLTVGRMKKTVIRK